MSITEDSLLRCIRGQNNEPLYSAIRILNKEFHNSSQMRSFFVPSGTDFNFVWFFCFNSKSDVVPRRYRTLRYRKRKETIRPSVLQVQVSEHIPVAVYGEKRMVLYSQGYGSDLLKIQEVGVVKTSELFEAEQAVISLLQSADIEILTQEMIAGPIPENIKKQLLATYDDEYLVGTYLEENEIVTIIDAIFCRFHDY